MDTEEAKKLWDDFAEDIKYKNRFFIKENILQILDKLIEFSGSHPLENYITYRARIGRFLNKKDEEMLMPPRNKARDGRGNPRGISYFYTATDIDTAIAEVRAFVGSVVTVAEVKPNRIHEMLNFNIMNILEKYKPRSTNKYKLELIDRYFLNILLKKLSEPILEENNIDFIPLQYIIEYVKNKGKDGILYKSAVGNGYNELFFSDDGFKVVNKTLYKIEKIKYKKEITEDS